MKRTLSLLAVTLSLLVVTGCDTFERRSQEKAAVVATLDAPTRVKLEHGIVEIGYTTDMVYLALGAPDDEFETTSAQGREKTWIFNSYHQDYAGNRQTGYRRVVVRNEKTNTTSVMLEPVYSDLYVNRTEERIRITFRDGKVAVIEQPKLP
jgi:hypothetical protein